MQKRNLTRREKIFLEGRGLKPENWYIEQETADYYQIISKKGRRRWLLKNEKYPKVRKGKRKPEDKK